MSAPAAASAAPAASSIRAPTLKGRVALITGASSGIGESTARLFAAAGAKLVLNGRDEKRLNAVAESIRSTYKTEVVTLIGGVELEATHEALVALALKSFGALHIAFNNSGVHRLAPLVATPKDNVDYIIDINFKGVVYGLKHQLAAIAKSATKDNWGVIINNSSTVGQKAGANSAVYSATKAAVNSLTRTAAIEGESLHIRVNAIAPGGTLSQGLLDVLAKAPKPVEGVAPEKWSLVPGLAQVDEIAQTVLFVASNETGRFFNGSILLQDGGYAAF